MRMWAVLFAALVPCILAANVNIGNGIVDVDVGLNRGTASVGVGVGGASRVELCNVDEEGMTGVCVKQGTCNNEYLGTDGVNLGLCDQKDTNGVQYQCCQTVNDCGSTTSSVVSYYQNPSFPAEDRDDVACNIRITARPRVCQLRVEFLEFELPRPDGVGLCSAQNHMAILSPGLRSGLLGSSNNRLCGINTGQHVYIPVSPGDDVQFVTMLSGVAAVPIAQTPQQFASSVSYRWNIRVIQIYCDDPNYQFAELQAPTGCLQYHTDSFGTLNSFNYDGTSIMAPNQDYAICIRNEGDGPGGRTCSITYRAIAFGVPVGGTDSGPCRSGANVINNNIAVRRECCLNPRSSFVAITGTGTATLMRRYWCGLNFGAPNDNAQITSRFKPFVVNVRAGPHTLADLQQGGVTQSFIGFSIDYRIDSGICNV